MRDITCAVLQQRPDPSNWSEYPNVWDEAQRHVYMCEWFHVYDIIERIWSWFKTREEASVLEEARALAFKEAINDFFVAQGIGWQLVKGEIVTAGCGLAQRWGGPIEQIRPGDVIRFPPGEKHWHGATATTAMTHIAIVEQLDGKSADWMEKVSDEQYQT
jgi:AbiJ-like protein